ncbi:hypothetical protein [Desulfuromonas sp. TF]|uniref:hypothetical protein n=1 Tax=Desulfuromonas sp. TF TaxID=1232410 RepID=UPI00040D2131|nr:hypothetical protein [Desulfuromonas sp. TF]
MSHRSIIPPAIDRDRLGAALGTSAIACLFFLLWTASLLPGRAAAAEYVSTPMRLQAKDLLPPPVLQGESYRIDDSVYNDGMFNLFSLTTDYGPMNAESETLLNILLAELTALNAMQQMERKKVFGEALVEGVKAPFKGAAALVTSPVETSKKIAKGTGQFFSNMGRAMFDDDPDQDNALKVAVGYDVAKRKFAYEFDINPYTTNEVVAERLGAIARAAVAGGVTTKVAMAAVDSDVVTAMRVSGAAQGMKQLVRDNPPGKLAEINGEKLAKIGVAAPMATAFLDNYNFDPYEETLLVGELDAMQGVRGREALIARAGQVTSRREAVLLRHLAQMMGGYHANVAPVAAMANLGGILTLQKTDGGLAIVFPADLVFWTPALEAKIASFEKEAGAGAAPELLVSGRLDASARERLAAKGWKITENANPVLFKEPQSAAKKEG